MTSPDTHRDMANAIRFLSADAVEAANSGHPGLPMGAADIVTGAPGADPGPSAGPGAFYVVFGEACPGDLSGDGMTDAADFVILAANFGMAVVPYTNGDMNGDGFVDAADFTILATSFGCGS